jgi:hypothetical protein
MNFNYKLFFKYILFHTNQIFLKYINKGDKNLNIYINENNLYFLTLHLKLSSLFYSTQLCEIFSYEIPTTNNVKNAKDENKIAILNNSILVYNFHSILFQQRFFVFVNLTSKKNINKNYAS